LSTCVKNSGGSTCYKTYEDRAELVKLINSKYDVLRQAYVKVKQASPGVRVYVVGYPQVAKVGGDCGMNVHLDADEVLFSSQLIDYLDSVIQRAAKAEGVVYVDAQHALDGHLLCEAGGSQSAVNGFTVGNDDGATIAGKKINFVGSESYHPTQLGHVLLAATIGAKTNGLSKAMPVAEPELAPPIFDDTLALLQNVPHENRPENRISESPDMSSDVLVRGTDANITVNGTDMQLEQNGTYNVVLHSNPVTLGTVHADAQGNIAATVAIPADIEPGFHTLHIYGRDIAGRGVDMQKRVYVAANLANYDGTLVNNPCVFVPAAGADVDQDGLDDACDPVIGRVIDGSTSTVATESTTQMGIIVFTSPQGTVNAQLPAAADVPTAKVAGSILGAKTAPSLAAVPASSVPTKTAQLAAVTVPKAKASAYVVAFAASMLSVAAGYAVLTKLGVYK
jgi:hypothetical protein